jgi:hypothetical protein
MERLMIKTWIVTKNGERIVQSGLEPTGLDPIEIPNDEELDWIDVVNGVASVNETKKAEVLSQRAVRSAEKESKKKAEEDAKKRVKEIDWSKVKDLKDLIPIVKDLIEKDGE